MHSLEAVEFYTQLHPRWFESIQRYTPGREHLDELERILPHDWSVQRSNTWYFASPPAANMPAQGWKLHISVSTADSVDALRRALVVLRDERASFKVIVDRRVTAWINGKLWPRGASGKFITIYPNSLAHFHRLGARLSEALRAFAGPYILSDRRWPGSRTVHYRYGGFVAHSRLRPDGTRVTLIATPSGELKPDRRSPFWDPPAWVEDPFPPEATPASASARLDGRFEVTGALGFSNRGGVYKAIDHDTGREVVLKEARPRVEVGSRNIEAVELLERERQVLGVLADTGLFVRPVSWFWAWEHAFLAEEFVAGEHLGRFSIRHNPIYASDRPAAAMPAYLERMRGLWLQIAEAIAAAHARGVVLGDLSFTNVLVGEDDRVVICDLETARRDGVDPPLGLHTPGMSATGVSERANDYFALGSLLFGSIMLAHGMTALHPPSRPRFLADLREDLGLTDELIGLIDELSTRPDRFEADPRRASASIERLRLCERGSVARLALPIEQRFDAERRVELRARVQAAVDGIADYLEHTADTSRRDRLVPADLMVFETNPLSLAHGAAGVLHALHHIRGRVPTPLLDWLTSHAITNDHYPPGLYSGQAGIAWVLAELGELERALALLRQAGAHELLFDAVGVLHGAAGYGLACVELWRRLGADELLDAAIRVGERLRADSVRDERGARWPDADDVVQLGYGHGGSGVALFLLELSRATNDPSMLQLGREALQFELAQGVWLDGEFAGFPAHVEEPSRATSASAVPEASSLSCYWEDGSAGVGTTVARYAAATGDASFREWLLRLAADASRKYTAFPQLFRGLAGLGNFLLDAWAQSGDERHLLAAWHAAEGVLLFRLERPEGLAFPGEQTRRESADLATGAAGVGLFLHRLLGAEQGRPNFNFVIDAPPR